MAGRKPAETFPPGEFLKDELEERGWTQSDFAEIIGRTVGTVNEIIRGKRQITPEIAHRLGAALGTSADLWLNLESAYQLSKIDDDGGVISRRARLQEKVPVNEMIRRGWIDRAKDVEDLERQVCAFLEIDSLDEEPVLLHAAKKSTPYEKDLTAPQKAWLARARQLSRRIHVRRFSEEGFQSIIERLKLLLDSPEETRHVPRILAEHGIRYVIVQPLSGTLIDGACFWDQGVPVIAMSLRYGRIDNFWFVLMHELGHVRQGLSAVDENLGMDSDDSLAFGPEVEANRFAVEILVPQERLDNFIARVSPLYSIPKITGFARTLGVHPGIVVRQLQFRRELPYSGFRNSLAKIRDFVTAAALTDGWGVTVSMQ